MQIASSAVRSGDPIPVENTCSGANLSPPLTWSGAPTETKSFALIVADPDAPAGVFYHWVAYDLPASSTGLPAAVPPAANLAAGGTQGINSFGTIGYKGPCPPHGKPHHYHFRLFALGIRLGLRPGADAAELAAAMKGHTLASADLVGTFQR
jgi:Raf kinase inhibitor-like YbhB/YbcL family protein